jgi:hypothetical protein
MHRQTTLIRRAHDVRPLPVADATAARARSVRATRQQPARMCHLSIGLNHTEQQPVFITGQDTPRAIVFGPDNNQIVHVSHVVTRVFPVLHANRIGSEDRNRAAHG